MRHARCAAVLLVVSVLLASPAVAQIDVRTVLGRASAFVETFQKDFGMMVAEERYEQDVRSVPTSLLLRGRGRAPVPTAAELRVVLRSDFLLVRSEENGWMPFRDVFERNGSPVRDREERLSKLFLENRRKAFEQAQAIMEESARYNVGNIRRTINVPTMALDFLTYFHRERFAFTDGGRDEIGRILNFTETGRPTYITTTNSRDLPVTGRFWVDEVTGRVERSELHALDPLVEAHITVTYRTDPTSGGWVPERMEESYKRRGDPAEVRGIATYTNFRRFQVTTTEEVAQ